MAVQMISMVVLSWNFGGLAPRLLRCMTIDQNIAPNTTMPMPTAHHHDEHCGRP